MKKFWNKRFNIMMIFACLCVVLAACGKGKDVGTENVTTEENSTEEAILKRNGEKELGDKSTSQSEEELAPGENVGEELSSNVQNNGGHFVSMDDDKIYYVAPDEEAMYESRVFAKYLDAYCGPSLLMAYSCKNDGLDTIVSGDFYGKLCVLQNRIFVNCYEVVDGSNVSRVAIVNPEEKRIDYAKGEVLLGGDCSGNYVVTRDAYGDDSTTLYIYAKDLSVTQLDIDNYSDFVGIEENSLIIATYRDEAELKCYDLSDSMKEYSLGAVPPRAVEGSGNYPEYEQLAVEDGKLYLSICWYEGTGHFLAEHIIVTANLFESDSLAKIEVAGIEETYDENARKFAVNAGNLVLTDGEPGKGFCDYVSGDYGYYDQNGKRVTCGGGFGMRNDENGDMTFINETAEYVNGRICMVNNNLARDPAEDVGWRYAYIRTFTSIFIEEANSDNGYNVENISNLDYVGED